MKNSFEERLQQIRSESNKDVIPQAASQEALLSFVNPTEFVELPSKGKFYPEGHPLKNVESVEIKQMTAKEEDILTNKSLIKNGLIIDRLIESLLVDRTINVSTILVGDKNAILVAARKSAYGASYDVTLNCTECNNRSILGIDLNDIKCRDAEAVLKEASTLENIDALQMENGNIIIKLPRTGWFVECKLMNGIDERKILNLLQHKRKSDPGADISISEQLSFIISSINASYDEVLIRRAIDAMPAYDAKFLRKTYQKLIPNIKIEKGYVCSSCGEEQEVEVPFTQEFFWPK